MEIFFSDIPDDGLRLAGKLSPQFFDLSDDDPINLTGDTEFELTLYRFEEVIVMSGRVEVPCELACVTCLETFPHVASFPSWNSEYDIGEREVMFEPKLSLRDEILLVLPSVPHCDDMMDDRICPKTELLQKFQHDEKPLEAEPDPDEGDDVWGALDALDQSK